MKTSPSMLFLTIGGLLVLGTLANAGGNPVRSPQAVVVGDDAVVVLDRTAAELVRLDRNLKPAGRTLLTGDPCAVTIAPGKPLAYVAERTANRIAVVDLQQDRVIRRVSIDGGAWPVSLAVDRDGRWLYVGTAFPAKLFIYRLGADGTDLEPLLAVPVLRWPADLAIGPDGVTVAVANQLPVRLEGVTGPTAAVSLVSFNPSDPGRWHRSDIPLPPGSSGLRGVAFSPDGHYVYAVHGLGRVRSPITQLERGWVNTNALSIIDTVSRRRVATVLLDDLYRGAADPADVVCSPDGSRLWVALAGSHELVRINIADLHRLLQGSVPGWLERIEDSMQANIWVRLRDNPSLVRLLENDLAALRLARVKLRLPAGGFGPRALAISSDGATVYVANYFSGSLTAISTADPTRKRTVLLGPMAEPDAVRRGALIFHDARRSFQHWHSCATCHQHGGRVDGLSWDFVADGLGNPKDTVSLIGLAETEPMNRRATVANAYDCVRNGLFSTNLKPVERRVVDDLFAYLAALRPEPSPLPLVDPKLAEPARRGKQLFEGKAGCAGCHSGPYLTDGKMHNVGTGSGHWEEADGRYDTPSLRELYRTAPYLHDGRAWTLREVLTTFNRRQRHGHVERLSAAELDDLIAYLLSL